MLGQTPRQHPMTSAGDQISVYIDGALDSNISLQSSSKVPRRILAIWSWGSVGTHTTELRNPAKSEAYPDAFMVFR